MSLDPFEFEVDESGSPWASPVSSPVGRTGDLIDEEPEPEPIFMKATVNGEDAGIATDEDEEEDDEDDDLENVDASFRERCLKQRAERLRINAILAQFTPEQMERYEVYRRSRFRRANMRKLLQIVGGCPVSVKMTILMSGIAKIYVGDLVEKSRMVMEQRNVTGPIRPCDLREAYRRLELEGKIPKLSRDRLFQS